MRDLFVGAVQSFAFSSIVVVAFVLPHYTGRALRGRFESIMVRFSAALAAIVGVTAVRAIPTISAKGSKFFTSDGNQFYVKGKLNCTF